MEPGLGDAICLFSDHFLLLAATNLAELLAVLQSSTGTSASSSSIAQVGHFMDLLEQLAYGL